MQVDELKTLVKELHRNGIEVILDVVFNHTAEGNERGPTISFRGIDNKTYYMLDAGGLLLQLHRHAATRSTATTLSSADLVLDCLRYWAAEYHIDGFRFDLAAILGRDPARRAAANPPLLEALAFDPMLGKMQADRRGLGRRRAVSGRIVSRPTAAGPNGMASTAMPSGNFSRAMPGMVGEMAQRMHGLAGPVRAAGRGTGRLDQLHHLPRRLHAARSGLLQRKAQRANGENNRDGANDNYSWNCGVRRADRRSRRSTRSGCGR